MIEAEVFFTRSVSAAEVIERQISLSTTSVVAALYRFNNPRLVLALTGARSRGVSVRVALNENDHYEENRAMQATLSASGIAFRLLHGRPEAASSKMHHKFAVLDQTSVLAGSYNWTLESEERNYENMLVIRAPDLVAAYSREFEALWAEGRAPERNAS
jgi:mitochondrial cardiolipin hydrolase